MFDFYANFIKKNSVKNEVVVVAGSDLRPAFWFICTAPTRYPFIIAFLNPSRTAQFSIK